MGGNQRQRRQTFKRPAAGKTSPLKGRVYNAFSAFGPSLMHPKIERMFVRSVVFV